MSSKTVMASTLYHAKPLHRYWFGVPDVNGRNLATCVWRDREHAIKGGVGPSHRTAANAARHNYTEWRIERLNLIIEDGVAGWSIVNFVNN